MRLEESEYGLAASREISLNPKISVEKGLALKMINEASFDKVDVFLLDLNEISHITTSLDTFDISKFNAFLYKCVGAVEKSTNSFRVSDGKDESLEETEERVNIQQADIRANGVDLYVWLSDLLTGIDAAIKVNDQKLLKEFLASVHDQLRDFISQIESSPASKLG